ncbi:hypothetical protein D3C85_1410330 [compost metagenome]
MPPCSCALSALKPVMTNGKALCTKLSSWQPTSALTVLLPAKAWRRSLSLMRVSRLVS